MKQSIAFVIVLGMALATLMGILSPVQSEIQQSIEIELIKSPDVISANSVGLYIYNVSNHGQTREFEVTVSDIPDKVHIDIIPDKFNLTPEQYIYVFVYVRTGDITLGEDFNMSISVTDVNQRAVSVEKEFSVSIAEKSISQMSFDISGWAGYHVIPIRHNPNAEESVMSGTDGAYNYLYEYLKYDMKVFDDVTTTTTSFVYLPSIMDDDLKMSSNIGSYVDVRYDSELGKFSVPTNTMTVKYSITNIGSSVIDNVKIQWEDIDDTDTSLSGMSESGYNYMGDDYISISSHSSTSAYNDNTLGALGNAKYTTRAFATNESNIFNPTPAMRSVNAMSVYTNSYIHKTTNEWSYSPTQLSKVSFTNVMPVSAVPNRGFIAGTLDQTQFSSINSIGNEFGVESGNDIFSKNPYDAITSHKLHVSGPYVGDGELYTGATSPSTPNIDDETGEIDVDVTPNKMNTGQIDDNIDVIFNIKDYLIDKQSSILSVPGQHMIVAYTVLKTYINIDTPTGIIRRNIVSMIPIVISIYVNADVSIPEEPPQPPSEQLPMKAVKIIKDISISSDTDSIVLESANSKAEIVTRFKLHGSILNYDPTRYNYGDTDILKIEITVKGIGIERDNSYISLNPSGETEETSLIGGKEETSMSVDTIINSAKRSGDTYTPAIFNGWTVYLDKNYIEKAPDSSGIYTIEDTISLTVLPPNDANAGDKFIFRLVINIEDAYRYLPANDIPSVGDDMAQQTPLPSDKTKYLWNDIISNSMLVSDKGDGTFSEVFGRYGETSTRARAIGDGVLVNTVFSSVDFTTDATAGSNFEPPTSRVVDEMSSILYLTAGLFMVILIVALSITAMIHIQSWKYKY